jgi:tetratricopeptide (TPR) repeat protein
MFGIVFILGVLISAVLLALDTKRRTGRIVYWRVIITVAITVFGAVSQAGRGFQLSGVPYDPVEFLGMYSGILAFFWFIVLRPRKLVDKIFREGSSLLKKGNIQQALTKFDQAADVAKSNKEKAPVLYNTAVCYIRLGQKEAAIKALSDVVSILPSLRSRMAKDKDFTELQGEEQFRALIAKG